MRSIAYAHPALPGFTGPKTYAAWPVWRDSTTQTVKFEPMPKKEAAKRWYAARRFDRQTHEPGKHGGAIGRSGLAVLYALLFDCLDFATGCLEPSYAEIAVKSGVCRRTVATALQKLRALGLLYWKRRSRETTDELGGFRLVQEKNAYAVLPPSQWRGFYQPPAAPLPEPGTWGDHPPLADAISEAATELRHGQRQAALAFLESDPGDGLAAVLARLGRAVFGPQA